MLGNTDGGSLAHDLLDSKEFSSLKGLKKDIHFIMLSDGFTNPLVHKNAPPSHETLMEEIRKAFEENFGVVPKLEIIRAESDDFQSTSFKIVAGNRPQTVGTVYYDAETSKIVSIHLAFEKEFPRK